MSTFNNRRKIEEKENPNWIHIAAYSEGKYDIKHDSDDDSCYNQDVNQIQLNNSEDTVLTDKSTDETMVRMMT